MTQPVIAYLRVEDLVYPRNLLLRSALAGRFSVRVVVRAGQGNAVRRYLRDLVAAWRATSGADVVVVAEFSLPFVPIAWAMARVRGASLVVDRFVGRHETVIGDWAASSPNSPRSAFARLVDHFSVRLADLVLIDTEVRAEGLRASHRIARSRVLSIAVGAPPWATSAAPRAWCSDGDPLRILYYGWYIPLHGVSTIIEALAATTRDVHLTLVGQAEHSGGVRDTRALAQTLSVDERCRFVDSAVGSARLAELVADTDVVLGVFGGSAKASGVVPNKVWQGLAMGRPVVTRRSPALDSLTRAVPPGQLITIPPEDPKALARVLDGLADAPRRVFPGTREIVDRLVERDLVRFVAAMASLVRSD